MTVYGGGPDATIGWRSSGTLRVSVTHMKLPCKMVCVKTLEDVRSMSERTRNKRVVRALVCRRCMSKIEWYEHKRVWETRSHQKSKGKHTKPCRQCSEIGQVVKPPVVRHPPVDVTRG